MRIRRIAPKKCRVSRSDTRHTAITDIERIWPHAAVRAPGLDQVVEIPMIGAGPSLDVAVPIRSLGPALTDWRPVEYADRVANHRGLEGGDR
jgi:hypothetical protein